MRITAQQVIEALEGEFDVRSYSGRGMYGAKCVGVDIDRAGQIMEIAAQLISAGIDVDHVIDLGDQMREDNMGRGIIVYWPALELSAEEHAALMVKELDEDDEKEVV
jgi:hypothetical protein